MGSARLRPPLLSMRAHARALRAAVSHPPRAACLRFVLRQPWGRHPGCDVAVAASRTLRFCGRAAVFTRRAPAGADPWAGLTQPRCHTEATEVPVTTGDPSRAVLPVRVGTGTRRLPRGDMLSPPRRCPPVPSVRGRVPSCETLHWLTWKALHSCVKTSVSSHTTQPCHFKDTDPMWVRPLRHQGASGGLRRLHGGGGRANSPPLDPRPGSQ